MREDKKDFEMIHGLIDYDMALNKDSSKRKLILMHGDDEKTAGWGKAIEDQGHHFVPLGRRPILFPLKILAASVRSRSLPDACYFRYVNDKKSLVRSLVLTASYMLAVFLCRILGVVIFWICHNIDKETHSYHPRLIAFTRAVLLRASRKVFVVDPLMVPHFKSRYPKYADKCVSITFGRTDKVLACPKDQEYVERKVHEFLARHGGIHTLVGLCSGALASKTKHFDEALRLLDVAEKAGSKLLLVIIGPVGAHRDAPLWMRDDRILFIDGYMSFDERRLAPCFDFFWRSLDDVSISYTVYVAATLAKPILTMDCGFVGQAVREYSLGCVLDTSMNALSQCLEDLKKWNPENATSFLRSHSWSGAARKLIGALDA